MPLCLLQAPGLTALDLSLRVAEVGFRSLGYAVETFDPAGASRVDAARADVVVAGVPATDALLATLGRKRPVTASFPPELAAFAGRRVWRAPLVEVRAAVSRGEPAFFKPDDATPKRFKGVLARAARDLVETAHLPDDLMVQRSDPAAFRSEHRVFVHAGDVVATSCYKGAPLLFPDAARIEAMLAAFASAPAGYGLDVAVDDAGRTVLVEVNDGVSLGAYGAPPEAYARLLAARWREIVAAQAPA